MSETVRRRARLVRVAKGMLAAYVSVLLLLALIETVVGHGELSSRQQVLVAVLIWGGPLVIAVVHGMVLWRSARKMKQREHGEEQGSAKRT
jgi:arginine exporter protein ArgO